MHLAAPSLLDGLHVGVDGIAAGVLHWPGFEALELGLQALQCLHRLLNHPRHLRHLRRVLPRSQHPRGLLVDEAELTQCCSRDGGVRLLHPRGFGRGSLMLHRCLLGLRLRHHGGDESRRICLRLGRLALARNHVRRVGGRSSEHGTRAADAPIGSAASWSTASLLANFAVLLILVLNRLVELVHADFDALHHLRVALCKDFTHSLGTAHDHEANVSWPRPWLTVGVPWMQLDLGNLVGDHSLGDAAILPEVLAKGHGRAEAQLVDPPHNEDALGVQVPHFLQVGAQGVLGSPRR
mmetsp:Transcript_8000/g.17369  ORF Transcript_8000/g.17369 Transcript_8000/m.17369 type:complete len:295 (+) Transcript_8000:645-1529(+)